VVFGNALFGSFPIVEFNEAIADFELNVADAANFSETAFQVLFACMLRKTSNIYFVRLDLFFTVTASGLVASIFTGRMSIVRVVRVLPMENLGVTTAMLVPKRIHPLRTLAVMGGPFIL